MRFLNLLVAASAVSAVTLAPREETVNAYDEIENFEPQDDIAKLGLDGLEALKELEARSVKSRSPGSCSLFNVSIRRDWYEALHLIVPTFVY